MHDVTALGWAELVGGLTYAVLLVLARWGGRWWP